MPCRKRLAIYQAGNCFAAKRVSVVPWPRLSSAVLCPTALRRSSSTLDVGAGVGDGQVASAGQAGREGARQLVAVPAGGLPAHLHRLLCQ